MIPTFYVEPGNEDFAPRVSRKGDAGADIKAFVKYEEGGISFSRLWQPFYWQYRSEWKNHSKLYLNGEELNENNIPDYGHYTSCATVQTYLSEISPTGAVLIAPGETVLVDTGFKVILPNTPEDGMVYQYIIVPRSGLAHKHGIVVTNSPGIIDSGYRGWVKVSLTNRSNNFHVFTHGARIAQGICERVVDQSECRITTDEADVTATERGEGGFGSTKV